MGRHMRIVLALAFAAALPNLAFAEDVPCLGGSPDIFKFVKWDLKSLDPSTTEVTLTVHNAADQNFNESEIKFRWGEWHQFFFKLKIPAKAHGDTTFMNTFHMPPRDAEMLQAITPTLCTVRTFDENGNKKLYD